MKCEEFQYDKFVEVVLILANTTAINLEKIVREYSEREVRGNAPAVLECYLHYQTCEESGCAENARAHVGIHRRLFDTGIRKLEYYFIEQVTE